MKFYLLATLPRSAVTRLHLRKCHAEAAARARLASKLANKPDYLEYEAVWSRFWQEKQYFQCKNDRQIDDRLVFSMIFPPPNITGNLHLGHALTVTIQDALARFKFMTGHKVFWVPGFDHAGIATHILLNRVSIKQYGKPTTELTSEEYDLLCNKWRDERMAEMKSQLESLGASFTHPFYYTLSPEMSSMVKEAFVQLFDLGILVRKNSLVNWSFLLQSTLSDIEIEWRKFYKPTLVTVPGYDKQVEYGTIYTVAYPIEGSNETIPFATTRIETLAGDVAIAVNPNDARYSKFVGQRVTHPLTGESLPIICDETISTTFGTGAMKVTPSHSALDFELCQKYSVPWEEESVFDENGNIYCSRLKPEFRQLNGMNRFAAKDEMVKIFSELGLFVRKSSHETMVPFCSRSGDVVEAITRHQWFVQMAPLVKQLKESLEANEITVTPAGGRSTWIRKWCASLSDWCISRQIKWGHRIPAFRPSDEFCDRICRDPESVWLAAYDEEDARAKLREKYPSLPKDFSIIQDDDVLDTWFSSALLPFSVISSLGWTKDSISGRENPFLLRQSAIYPLSLMETGHDILPFWVHKMAILSKVLTGSYGFKKVLMHGMICDAKGKKMTKSKGNVIDPLDVIKGASLQELLSRADFFQQIGVLSGTEIESAKSGTRSLFPKGIPTCGTDALRMSLVQQDIKPTLIKVSIDDFTKNRALVNKIWQSYRFVESVLGKVKPFCMSDDEFFSHLYNLNSANSISAPTLIDQWILSRMSHFIRTCLHSYQSDACDLHVIHSTFYEFWVTELCDIYLEYVKDRIKELSSGLDSAHSEDTSRALAQVSTSASILIHCMSTCLRVTHPILPFVTEELYQRICHLLQTFASNCEPLSDKMDVTLNQIQNGMEGQAQSELDKCKLMSILQSGFPRDTIYIAWIDCHLDSCMHITRQILRTLRHLKTCNLLSRKNELTGSVQHLTQFIVQVDTCDDAPQSASTVDEDLSQQPSRQMQKPNTCSTNGANSSLSLDILSKMSVIIQDDFKYPVEIVYTNGTSDQVDVTYVQLVKHSHDDDCQSQGEEVKGAKEANPQSSRATEEKAGVTFAIFGK